MSGASAIEGVRREIAALTQCLREARLADFNRQAVELEARLPALLRGDGSGGAEAGGAKEARALRSDLLRLAALLELTSAYGRARLSLEQPAAEAYGPGGAPRRPRREATRLEA